MGYVQDSPVSTSIISNECMIYHKKVHILSYNLSPPKKFQNPKLLFGTFWTQIKQTSHCDKDRIFWKNFLKNKEMVFESGVKNIQAAAYKRARKVFFSDIFRMKRITFQIP